MTVKEMVQAANSFSPKVLIPMHYGKGLGTKNDGEEVKKLFGGKTVVMLPEK
jgi:L-ascorbate metabolism protein UlaG (beta-lactamase superfamily)